MNGVSLTDKIELIYEFNDKSPLFARVAFIHYENKEYEKALPILEDGLKNFPNYPTALLINSLVLINLGRKEEAQNALDKACDLIDSESTKEYYLEEFEKITSELFSVTTPIKKGFNTDELDLGELAKKIESAKMPKFDEKTEIKEINIEQQNNKIVSETMADILMAQGNLIEALDMYEQLLQKKPADAARLENKISMLNKKLSQ